MPLHLPGSQIAQIGNDWFLLFLSSLFYFFFPTMRFHLHRKLPESTHSSTDMVLTVPTLRDCKTGLGQSSLLKVQKRRQMTEAQKGLGNIRKEMTSTHLEQGRLKQRIHVKITQNWEWLLRIETASFVKFSSVENYGSLLPFCLHNPLKGLLLV